MQIENSVIFFPCIDIEETHRFYAETVGLRLSQIQSGGACRIYDTGYGYIGFCQYDDGRPIPSGPTGMCISLNCPNEAAVDHCYGVLTKKGVPVLSPPQRHTKFPVYGCFFSDPNGYKVEFQRILEGDELTGGRI
jgi:catechol 2,3-dioxygenase-like lactoylglutathione lyase family enzyme